LSKLGPLDFGVFAFYMALLVGVGVWFTRRQQGLKSYLLADQNIHWIIVAVSVLAALFSGITYLGAPAESFFHDLGYLWVVVSFFIATPITTLIFLPFFRNLNLYTAYEYLEKRFDVRLRWIASGLFILRVTCYLGLAISAPALAIMEITGWDFWLSALLTGLAATVYTSLGGMKAVIWTDSIQFIVLCGGIVLILGYAIAEIPGGLPAAWQYAAADGKTTFVNWDLRPTVRITVWGALLGGGCNNLVQMVTDQISVQRYLTAPSLKDSQRALWFKLWVTLPLVGLFYLTGTVLYGYYRALPDRVPAFHNAKEVPKLHQPTDTGQQHALPNDRLLPNFVVQNLPSPLPGLLIAAVFGATMAVVSAGINSLATAALMDFQPRQSGTPPSERTQFLVARGLTIGFGILATGLALLVAQLGTLVEATLTIMGLFGGPLLGIFFLGVLSRRANGSGALIGAVGGAIAGGLVAFSGKLFSYGISFVWIAFSAASVTFILGRLASWFFPAPSPEARSLVWRKSFSPVQPAKAIERTDPLNPEEIAAKLANGKETPGS
jgi:sodium-coupled monocarboxylate transporter 8/12